MTVFFARCFGQDGVIETHGAVIKNDSFLLSAQDMTEALRESLKHTVR